MSKSVIAAIAVTGVIAVGAGVAWSSSARPEPQRTTLAVAIPARPGPVTGTSQNSDEFTWRLLTQFAAPVSPSRRSPVVFETWASDADVFTPTPRWPGPDAPKKFQASRLGAASAPAHGSIDVPCNSPPGAAVGGFPTTGTPTPCIAEEVKRNRPQFDYIVRNQLNTTEGLAAAYAKNFKVVMPTAAVSVKGDWIPLRALLQWIPSLRSVENIRRLYYTNTSDSVEYALVALHVSSRQNTNWVWGTFEHQMNPGRCDDIGCYDTFGARIPDVPANRRAVNTQYGACPKTERLKTLMSRANLSPAWENYCLKATMVDYTAPDGTPYALGNSVIERITGNGTVAASSCISCHAYASFGAQGYPTGTAMNILPYNPTGKLIPAVLQGSVQFDFMWGVVNLLPPPS